MKIRVPASTSNLGPGFDLVGLALSLWLEVELLGPAPGAEHVLERLEGEAGAWPRGPRDNLLLRAFDAALAALDAPRAPSRFGARSEIPLARGLGSSGAAIAAGLLLGEAVAARPLDEARRLTLGVELEGHPDNVVASLLGGATLALPVDGVVHARRLELSPSIGFAVAWPSRPQSTAAARAALPREVPFADAVENPRRLAFLLAGLRDGDPEALTLGGHDRLHEPYRLPLQPGAAEALSAARRAGAWLATLSGSGSALVALGPPAALDAIADALRVALAAACGEACARTLDCVREAPRVTPS